MKRLLLLGYFLAVPLFCATAQSPDELMNKWLATIMTKDYQSYEAIFHSFTKTVVEGWGGFDREETMNFLHDKLSSWYEDGTFAGKFSVEHDTLLPGDTHPEWGHELYFATLELTNDQIFEVYMAYDGETLAILGYRFE